MEEGTAQIIQDLATASAGVIRPVNGAPFVIIPESYKLEYTAAEELPEYIAQQLELTELDSFIEYVKRFKTATTAIFARTTPAGASFCGVLDYHTPGKEPLAGWTKHLAGYSPAYSPEFTAWLEIDRKPLTQDQFLDHLRRWGDTIGNATDADLIELASSLDFNITGEYSSHVERTTGGRKLLFNEKVEGSAQVKNRKVDVPAGFALGLPIFTAGKSYGIDVDLLYRPANGVLRIICELRRPHLVVRQAIKDLVADVEAGTGIKPLIGALR